MSLRSLKKTYSIEENLVANLRAGYEYTTHPWPDPSFMRALLALGVLTRIVEQCVVFFKY